MWGAAIGAVTVQEAIKLVLANKGPGRFGRTKLMKHLYFLKEVGGLEVDVDFKLYSYGPFSSAVLRTLNELSHAQQVAETPPDEDQEASSYDYALAQGEGTALGISDVQKQLIENLTGRSALELEALSTLHLTSRLLESTDEDLVVERVKNMKPYFRIEALRAYWRELKRLGWIAES